MSPLSRFQSTIVLVALALMAACAPPPPASVPAPPSLPVAGLERVMGKDERALLALFGEPDLDVREGHARKYQFAGPFCVLDVYLYTTSAVLAPVVTYVEARDLKGADLDRASCIAAPARRPAAPQAHNPNTPFHQDVRPPPQPPHP